MVTELMQCDLYDALRQGALAEQLSWRRRGYHIALDIAKGLSCERPASCPPLGACRARGPGAERGCKPRSSLQRRRCSQDACRPAGLALPHGCGAGSQAHAGPHACCPRVRGKASIGPPPLAQARYRFARLSASD